MTPIIIPAECIPDPTIILGFSGGMPLYVAHWESLQLLFEGTNVAFLAYSTIHYYKHVN